MFGAFGGDVVVHDDVDWGGANHAGFGFRLSGCWVVHETVNNRPEHITAHQPEQPALLLDTHPAPTAATFSALNLNNSEQTGQLLAAINAGIQALTSQRSPQPTSTIQHDLTPGAESENQVPPINSSQPNEHDRTPNQSQPQTMTAGATKVLLAMARFHPGGLTKTSVAHQADMPSTNPGFNRFITELRDTGLITFDDSTQMFHTTPAGVAANKTIARTGGSTNRRELTAAARASLKSSAARMFDQIVAAGISGIQRTDLMTSTSISETSFRTYLSTMKSKEIIVIHGAIITAAPHLLPATEPQAG